MTAFVVVVDSEGSPSLIMDIPNDVLDIERQPTLRDVRRSLLDLSADLAAQASAQYASAYLRDQQEEKPAEKVAKAVAKRRSTKKDEE
jgi:hypothetical protein